MNMKSTKELKYLKILWYYWILIPQFPLCLLGLKQRQIHLKDRFDLSICNTFLLMKTRDVLGRRPNSREHRWFWLKLLGGISHLSGRAQSECQLCEQRYVHIISCHFGAETQATQADREWWIRQDFCQRAKVFPHIRGENKHSHVRKQTRSTRPPNSKTNLHEALPCLYETFLAVTQTRTHPHHVPLTASPLTSSLLGLITHAGSVLHRLSLTVMWPRWWCHTGGTPTVTVHVRGCTYRQNTQNVTIQPHNFSLGFT